MRTDLVIRTYYKPNGGYGYELFDKAKQEALIRSQSYRTLDTIRKKLPAKPGKESPCPSA